MWRRLTLSFVLALIIAIVVPAGTSISQVPGADLFFTTDADFDQGTLVSVNHDISDQLQLDDPTEPFPFINVAASGRGTVVRINTETGEVLGEYRTAPEEFGGNPSRTTVDLFGAVWTGNRDEYGLIDGVPHGSAVKIGLIVGGTRADAEGTPNPLGDFLAPPYGYNTCVDRNADGLIATSRGLEDVRGWIDSTGGIGDVADAQDECVLVYQRLPDAEAPRHLSVDANNDVWVGGYPFDLRMFHKLDGETGTILDSFDARDFGCGGYGGLIDGNGVLWSVGGGWGGDILWYDPATRQGMCIQTHGGSYGLGIDTNGFVWNSFWEGAIVKIAPDGSIVDGFPKGTFPPSGMTATAAATFASQSKDRSVSAQPAQAAEPATFWLAPDDDWVSSSSNGWTPGATVTVTIEDGGGGVYSDSTTVDTGGGFNFNLWDVFDLQRGHVVTVDDGTTTKTHTVADLFVDGTDVAADTVFGRTAAGTDVEVWVHDNGNLIVTADGSGTWVADFSGMTDLTYTSDGGSQQTDTDGDSTGVWWTSPRFRVAPNDDWVQSSGNWTPGATVTLTIEDGGSVVYSDSTTADNAGRFNFNLWDVFDLQRGHVVTVDDGTTTKMHTVADLFVDGTDVAADTVFGRTAAGTDVEVWVHDNGNLIVTADGSGTWVADFSGLTDLTYGSDGGSQQTDTDGDSTGVWWNVRDPRINIHRDSDFVVGSEFEPLADVTIMIDGVEVGSAGTDEGGNFWFDHSFAANQTVSADDGKTVKTHIVTGHTIQVVDHVENTASGTAEPFSWLTIEVNSPTNLHRGVQADSTGMWFTDFDLPDAGGQTDDITPDGIYVWQTDDDRDNTTLHWRLPWFRVDLDDDRLGGDAWTRNAVVEIYVNDNLVDTLETDDYGSFASWPSVDLAAEQVVTVVGPVYTKTLLVADLQVTDVDSASDTVSGLATAGTQVEVVVHTFSRPVARKAIADQTGAWTADFSVPAVDPTNDDWENQVWDIRPESRGSVDEWDDDGDVTTTRFGPPLPANRGVAVTPVDNDVWVAQSFAGTVVRLDNDGNVKAFIETGPIPGDEHPTGVAVDAAGKVWVTNLQGNDVVRIDPATNTVDLTVDLGDGASPYNYSDMTGAVAVGSTSPQGFWSVIQDSGDAGFWWGRIAWNTEPEGSEPAGTAIVVEARAADTVTDLAGAPFMEVTNGELFDTYGRFIEVRVTLKASPEGVSPVLSDIRISPHVIEVAIDIKPGSDPNSINIRAKGVVPVAVLGSDDFDVTAIDVTTLRFGPGEAEPKHNLTKPKTLKKHLEDVNLDGFMDLVSHYKVPAIGLSPTDTEACIVGATVSGVPIYGCDAVRIIGR